MSPSPVPEGGTRGYIIPIGGAEKKMRNPDILRRFVALCGGDDAQIAIVPTASELKETGRRYEKVFGKLGVSEARAYPFMSRGDCEREDLLADFESATGVFLTGGNQLRLSTTVGGTAVARTIRRLNASGVPVAGTSAGAGFLSEHMIAFGDEGFSPRADIVTLAPGLGLTNRVVVDHHFRQRERLGRLLTAIGYNPFVIGVGLDEDTAAFIDSDDRLEVVGTGGLTIADGHELEFSSMDSARQDDPVCLVGLKIHVLVAGWTFDIVTRTAAEPADVAQR